MKSTRTHLSNLHLAAAALAASWAISSPTLAQEVLPREQAMRYALVAALHEPASMAAPIRVDADLKRPFAGHEGEYGALILPETKLTAATLQAAGKEVIPVGQLWLRHLSPVVNGSAVDTYDLQMVSVRHEEESARVPLCLLGVRRTDSGGLELLVYGKGKEPLTRIPLEKLSRTQTLPIEFTGEREDEAGKLRLHFVGQYVATLPVTELSE